VTTGSRVFDLQRRMCRSLAKARVITGDSVRPGRRAGPDPLHAWSGSLYAMKGGVRLSPGRNPAATRSRCRWGLEPTPLVKIPRVFASPTAKNRHLPPRSVSGGHNIVTVGVEAGLLRPARWERPKKLFRVRRPSTRTRALYRVQSRREPGQEQATGAIPCRDAARHEIPRAVLREPLLPD
jgi:hypothetical protein